MYYVASVSSQVNDTMREKQISEFNAQFEGYANRSAKSGTIKEGVGYKGIANAISVQEFATLYNLASEWNKNNESEKIEMKCIGIDGFTNFSTNINVEFDYKVEEFMGKLGDKLLESYVIFTIPEDAYTEGTGRISKLNFILH